MNKLSTIGASRLRTLALIVATLCILAGGLAMPTRSAQAGFTPTPAPPTSVPPTSAPPTSVPPTSTPAPAPTSTPSSGGGGGGGGGGVPAAAAPPAPAPLPETGQADWWLTLVLFFWGGSLLLLLPLIGPLHRCWKRQFAARDCRPPRS